MQTPEARRAETWPEPNWGGMALTCSWRGSYHRRPMKKAILFSFAALVTAPLLVLAAGGDDNSIMELEKKAWDTYKNRQTDAFKALCAPTYTGIYDVGMKDPQKEVADINDTEIRSVNFSDMHVTHPKKNVAIVTYKADAQGGYKGKDFSGTYNCSGVWVNEGGKWLCVLHTEVKAGTQ
jgi:Domain of unknown function (DUF4440)